MQECVVGDLCPDPDPHHLQNKCRNHYTFTIHSKNKYMTLHCTPQSSHLEYPPFTGSSQLCTQVQLQNLMQKQIQDNNFHDFFNSSLTKHTHTLAFIYFYLEIHFSLGMEKHWWLGEVSGWYVWLHIRHISTSSKLSMIVVVARCRLVLEIPTKVKMLNVKGWHAIDKRVLSCPIICWNVTQTYACTWKLD